MWGVGLPKLRSNGDNLAAAGRSCSCARSGCFLPARPCLFSARGIPSETQFIDTKAIDRLRRQQHNS